MCGKRNGKIELVSYNTLNYASKSGKVPKIAVGNTRSNWICIRHTRLTHGYLMPRNNQHAEMQHVETRDWQLNIFYKTGPNRGTAERKTIFYLFVIQFTQCPRWHKDTTGKGLLNWEDSKVSKEISDVWGNIGLMDGRWDQYTESSVLLNSTWNITQ